MAFQNQCCGRNLERTGDFWTQARFREKRHDSNPLTRAFGEGIPYLDAVSFPFAHHILCIPSCTYPFVRYKVRHEPRHGHRRGAHGRVQRVRPSLACGRNGAVAGSRQEPYQVRPAGLGEGAHRGRGRAEVRATPKDLATQMSIVVVGFVGMDVCQSARAHAVQGFSET